ncbi:MAG: hypothetical protein U9O98_09900 [Asgard group archaeon]|nr:hypothetical protein [Asgard group archaeon]
MNEVTDLHVLAKLSLGTPDEEDAFIIRDSETNEVKYKIHNLRDLLEVLAKISPQELFPSLCRMEEGKIECDLALWVHYVLGDATLSAKIYNLIHQYKDDPEKLKLEVQNLCFNRYLNYQELTNYGEDELLSLDEENSDSPTDI